MKLTVFSHQKCLNSIPLNILGFQPFRYTLGKILYWLKYNLFNPKNKNNEEEISSEVIEKGYADKNNFIEAKEFEKIKKEFDLAIYETNSIVEKELGYSSCFESYQFQPGLPDKSRVN